MSLPLDRSMWEAPPVDDPAVAHITPDLRRQAVPIDVLEELPSNPNEGDQGIVSLSLDKFTQRKAIVVDARTGHVEAGNTTLRALRAAGAEWVAVTLVDDDEAMKLAYAVMDNRSNRLGRDDPARLAAALVTVREFDLLDFTGFDPEDLDDLMVEVDASVMDGGIDVADEAEPSTSAKALRSELADRVAERNEGMGDEHGTARFGLTPPERRAAYEASSVRSLVLSFDLAQYAWITARLAELRRSRGFDSNTDMVLALVGEATGSRAPNLPEEARG